MSEMIKEKLTRWSMERVKFLLEHLEDFIEDENQELRERARNFTPQGGLEGIESLTGVEPQDPRLPVALLEGLSPFFDAGLLLQRGRGDEGNWWVTDLCWRGNVFHLELQDQARATSLVPEITPMQVHRAPAAKVLPALNMGFLSPAADAESFLIKPTPVVGYLLITNFGKPWLADHLTHAHRLVNKSFLY